MRIIDDNSIFQQRTKGFSLHTSIRISIAFKVTVQRNNTLSTTDILAVENI